MTTTYTLRSGTETCPGSGADFNRQLAQGTESPGSIAFSVANLATEDSYGTTPAGNPGAGGQTGNFTVEVDVTAGTTAVQISVALRRVNASCVTQQTGSFSSEQQASAGLKTFSFTNLNLGAWVAGDRLVVIYRFRSTQEHGGAASITIETGTADTEVMAPWTLVSSVDKTHTTDALLKAAAELAHQADALLKGTLDAQHQADALLKASEDLIHTTDALLKAFDLEQAHTTDALLKQTSEVQHQTDALLKASSDIQHQADALLKATADVQHQTDSLLVASSDLEHTTDAFLKATQDLTHTTDALLKAFGLERTHTTDAFLAEAGVEVEHTTDALLKGTLDIEHSTDALLKASAEQAHTTDALLKAEAEVAHETDALFKATQDVGHTTDSLLKGTLDVEHSADALLKGTLEVGHQSDSLLKAETDISHSTDSFLVTTIDVAHTTDAFLVMTSELDHATDALLKVTQERAHSTDAYLIDVSNFTAAIMADPVVKSGVAMPLPVATFVGKSFLDADEVPDLTVYKYTPAGLLTVHSTPVLVPRAGVQGLYDGSFTGDPVPAGTAPDRYLVAADVVFGGITRRYAFAIIALGPVS